ncbi:BPSL0067 family protein [Calothrix sp. 336/3]|uniref:BPSL0067 family protein n=1 Tax=Calothrix sp. 336/3 TaxID=1337936 RepID=UPI00069B0BF2|nr:BPSL0067 family protein [Calothrix sp. 336/3]
MTFNTTENKLDTTQGLNLSAVKQKNPLEISVNGGSHSSIINDAIQEAQISLQGFAASSDFADSMNTAFGTGWDAKTVSKLQQSWLMGSFGDLPQIKVSRDLDLIGANGAYASKTDTIYFSQDFVERNAQNIGAIKSVLLEEIGHAVDFRINQQDAAGDEGDIFQRIVQKNTISENELGNLKTENDFGTLVIDGKTLLIEQNHFQAAIASSPVGGGFTKARGGWTNNNDFPRMMADVNGDGRADIVGFGENQVFVSLGNGNGTYQTAITSSPVGGGFTKARGGWTNNNDFPRMMADVNGDGRADIVGFGENQVFVSLSIGNGTFHAAIASSPGFTKNRGGWTNNNDFPRMMADVNGDGRADIVGFSNSQVFVSLGNGNGTFQTAITSSPGFTKSWSWANNNDFPRMMADVNGDSRADIIGFHETLVYVSLSNGNGTFQAATASSPGFTKNRGGWANNKDFPRMMADINGDRRADIVAFGETQVFVSLGNGNGTFQAATASSPGFTKNRGGWTNHNDFPRMMADVNGDRRADIVGFGETQIFTSLNLPTPPGLMSTAERLTQLRNGQLNGKSFDVDRAFGAQCWDLVAYATGINISSPYWLTTNWKRGANVMADGNIAVGTAIATFLGRNNTYDAPGSRHTGIFAGYGTENGVRGFYIWHQNWDNKKYVQKSFIRNDRSGTSDADNYHVILT